MEAMDYSVADTTPQHPANRLDDLRSVAAWRGNLLLRSPRNRSLQVGVTPGDAKEVWLLVGSPSGHFSIWQQRC